MANTNKLWSPKPLSSPLCIPAGWSEAPNVTRTRLIDKAYPCKPPLSTSLDHHCYNNSNKATTWHLSWTTLRLTQRWEWERHYLPNATHPEPHGLEPGNSGQLYELHMLHSQPKKWQNYLSFELNDCLTEELAHSLTEEKNELSLTYILDCPGCTTQSLFLLLQQDREDKFSYKKY